MHDVLRTGSATEVAARIDKSSSLVGPMADDVSLIDAQNHSRPGQLKFPSQFLGKFDGGPGRGAAVAAPLFASVNQESSQQHGTLGIGPAGVGGRAHVKYT